MTDDADRLRALADDCRGLGQPAPEAMEQVLDVMADFCDCLARMVERADAAAAADRSAA